MKQQPTQALLMQAVALHQQGQLDQAKALYEQVLEKQPRNFDALHLSGVVALQRQAFDLAVKRISKAIAVNPKQAAAHSNLGAALKGLNQFSQALDSYDKAISLEPSSTGAHFNRGNVLLELKRWDEAKACYAQVIDQQPEHAAAHLSLGNVYKEIGRFEEAIGCYEQAIVIEPSYAQAYSNCGIALKELGRFSEALAYHEQALAINDDYSEAHFNRGIVLHKLGRLNDALDAYQLAIAKRPEHPDAYNAQGVVLQELNRWHEALDSFNQAIIIRPDYAQAYVHRANLMHKLKRLEESLDSYEQALQIEPENPEIFNNCGAILYALNRWAEALTSYNSAINIKPDYAEAHNNRGATLQKMGRFQESLSSFSNALTIENDYADAHANRGILFLKLNRLDEAVIHYDRALEIDPNYEFLRGTLIYLHSHLCQWRYYDQNCEQLQTQLRQGQRVSLPFVTFGLFDDPAIQKSANGIWAQASYPDADPLRLVACVPMPPLFSPETISRQKLRLAYYSSDFHNHATAYLMAQLFECHDRERFELFAFSFGPDSSDPMRQRLVAAFDHFIDVSSDSDQAIAQRSRELGIDIAVDLKGYTRDSRPGIFACRCAPVQVNYLGYPGTMGAPFMDYLIADKVVIPPESQAHYSEQVVYLPHSYQVNDSHREIADTVWRKADLGLPEEGFVFCCFNNSYKITPHTFASWMRILQAVPGSVLWLLGDNETAQRNLRRYAQEAGVEPERLVFAPRMPLAEHLARHRAADLFLDTLPCNAHTTASDALWAGLPVLTQQGQAFAARVAASLLTAVGLPELIVQTAQQYEELAIVLAKDSERLHHIKQKLAVQRDTSPLFNAQQFARHIEQAYQTMHERAQAGLVAQGFEVVG